MFAAEVIKLNYIIGSIKVNTAMKDTKKKRQSNVVNIGFSFISQSFRFFAFLRQDGPFKL